ncbi:MAG: class I SAM-dependent methyltransferase [Actinomycetota bacterium]|nr:class I SAM-dependent methyltransferase [Actinomycetota bacterium]
MTHLTGDLLEFFERWLPDAPARVLEVGCGDGWLTRYLISAGFEATGIDPDAPDGEPFQRITVEEFRPPQPFDAAIAVCSLHHVADPVRAVVSLHALIRSGGRLVLFEFAVEHLDEAARRWLEENGLGDELDYDYSDVVPLSELERALALGFRPLAREPATYLARFREHEDLHHREWAAIQDGTLQPVGMKLAYERE